MKEIYIIIGSQLSSWKDSSGRRLFYLDKTKDNYEAFEHLGIEAWLICPYVFHLKLKGQMPIAEKATENRELVFPHNEDGAKDNSVTPSTVSEEG